MLHWSIQINTLSKKLFFCKCWETWDKKESSDWSALVSFSCVRISRGQQMEQFFQTTVWMCQHFKEHPSLFLPQWSAIHNTLTFHLVHGLSITAPCSTLSVTFNLFTATFSAHSAFLNVNRKVQGCACDYGALVQKHSSKTASKGEKE